ncbi:MAG TPA: hypothetical protein VFM49_17860 [Chloroflexia bacterium]|nr:hypothetical protein [Chloroflexia bacterium]
MQSWITRWREARATDLEAQATEGQAAVDLYEQNEHAKFGLFLQELERAQVAALNSELARLRPGSEPAAEEQAAADEPAPETEE